MSYVGIGPERGNSVDSSEAYEYALDRCLNGPDHEEFREMLLEWFYSGNWKEVPDGKD